MRGWWYVVLAACGFQHGFLTGHDAAALIDAPDAGGDGPTAPAPTACVQHWLDGPTFSAPSLLANVSTALTENDPYVTADELTIYVSVSGDIYKATRGSTAVDFGAATLDTDLSSTGNDTKLSLTGDELTVFINSTRPGSQASDVWRGVRATTSDAWTFDRTYLGNVDDANDQWDPHISRDGLRLYLAPIEAGEQHVRIATRGSPTDDFTTPALLTEIDSTSTDNDVTVSGDERVIVFATNRTGNRGLWYAVRADPSGTFGAPVEISVLNTPDPNIYDDGPTLSADGCHLYFTSQRTGNGDVYVSSVM